MEERITLKLSEETIDRLKDDSELNHKYLYEDLITNLEEIRLMITGYFFVDRKRVYDLIIEKSSLVINQQGKGKVTVRYTLGMLDGCSGIDKSQEDSMNISINTNLEAGEVLLVGENFPEREPDDF